METVVLLFIIAFIVSIVLGAGSKKKGYGRYSKKSSYTFSELVKDIKNMNPHRQNIYNPNEFKTKEYFFKDSFQDIGKNNQTYNQESAYKKEDTRKKRMTDAEKKEKGDEYEKYIADFFRKNGYYVWEHGKEKGMQDSSIDLIIKREEYIYFVQCKNWERWKIDHKEVKATRTDVRDYLKSNEEFYNMIKNYKQKILYVTSKNCLTAGAYTYIEENKEILEYKVIPMEA